MGKRTTDATKVLTLEIGKRARIFRQDTGWSMKQVADKLDLSITAVAEFEKGRSSSSNVLLGYVGLGFPVSDLEEVCTDVYAGKVFRPRTGANGEIIFRERMSRTRQRDLEKLRKIMTWKELVIDHDHSVVFGPDGRGAGKYVYAGAEGSSTQRLCESEQEN